MAHCPNWGCKFFVRVPDKIFCCGAEGTDLIGIDLSSPAGCLLPAELILWLSDCTRILRLVVDVSHSNCHGTPNAKALCQRLLCPLSNFGLNSCLSLVVWTWQTHLGSLGGSPVINLTQPIQHPLFTTSCTNSLQVVIGTYSHGGCAAAMAAIIAWAVCMQS